MRWTTRQCRCQLCGQWETHVLRGGVVQIETRTWAGAMGYIATRIRIEREWGRP